MTKFVIRMASGELVQDADGDVAKYATAADAAYAAGYIKTPCTVEPLENDVPAWLATIERALAGEQVTEDEAVAATEALGALREELATLRASVKR